MGLRKIALMQLLQKLRAAPGFLAEARKARSAYQHQMQMADCAVDEWVRKQVLAVGKSLRWLARPDAAKVGKCTHAAGSSPRYSTWIFPPAMYCPVDATIHAL